MKIVDKKKFIRMIIIILGMICFCLISFSNISFSKGNVKTKTVYVCSGDTLWTIAKIEQENNAYFENKDVRDIINNIKQINNLSNSNLYVNQKIEIPYI